MNERKQFLDKAYELDGLEEARALYDAWAPSYDADVAESGYATPRRAAEALAKVCKDRAAPLLDLGCGTGVSGAAFREAGFTTIDGCDISDEMLKKAEEKGIYRKLLKGDMDELVPCAKGDYQYIAAVGVLIAGHAPPETIDAVLARLPRGGLFVFSLNDHALAGGRYSGRLNEHLDSGQAVVLFRERGAHLPARDMQSTIYVLRKS